LNGRRDRAVISQTGPARPTFVIAAGPVGSLLLIERQETIVITDTHDEQVRNAMEYALELACRGLPTDRQGHEWRKLVAEEISRCAEEGGTSLSDLIAAGRRAVITMCGGKVVEAR
jgi:hypothetical protein